MKSDVIYIVMMLLSAWFCASCIYWGDWLDLVFISTPFIGWTLQRGGLHIQERL